MFELSMSTILYSYIYCLNVSCALFHCESETWSCAWTLIERSRRQFGGAWIFG
jgi:hypothetical protein